MMIMTLTNFFLFSLLYLGDDVLSAKKGMNRDLKLLFFFHFAKGIKTYWGGVLKLSNSLFFLTFSFFMMADVETDSLDTGYGFECGEWTQMTFIFST